MLRHEQSKGIIYDYLSVSEGQKVKEKWHAQTWLWLAGLCVIENQIREQLVLVNTPEGRDRKSEAINLIK